MYMLSSQTTMFYIVSKTFKPTCFLLSGKTSALRRQFKTFSRNAENTRQYQFWFSILT